VRGLGARVVAHNGTYTETVIDGITPFSMATVTLSVVNTGRVAVMLDGLALEPVAPTDPYEWAFTQPGNTERVPFTFAPRSLAPGASVSVGLHFIPIASGPRNVRFVVRYAAGQTYSVTVVSRGRDNLVLSPNASNALERVFARSNAAGSNGIQPGAIVADTTGNVFFNLNATQWSDRFNLNVVLARVNADGRLGWVRELNELYTQDAIDIGNNGEVGGNPNSLAIDSSGGLYAVFERSSESHNTLFQAAVIKVEAATGNVLWATGLNQSAAPIPTLVREGLVAHAVNATLADRVIVAGSNSAGGFFLAALNKTNGALLWAHTVTHSGTQRVGALVVAPDGAAFLGGISNNNPFVARVNGVSGATPSVAWMQSLAVFGSNVRGLALEGDGVLAAINVRGADTNFVGARLRASDGSVVWARGWDGGSSDRNNTMAVATHGGQAIFAGRIGVTGFDPTGGDGFLLSLNPATGAYHWGSIYYTGRGAEEIMTDYITGVVSTSNGLWVLHQQTPGPLNPHHYWGFWYQAIDNTLAFPGGTGSMRLMPYTLSASAVTPVMNTTMAVAHSFAPAMSMSWLDQTSTVTSDDPRGLETMSFQAGTQVLLQRVDVR
jgi:hypothetical protein